MPQTANPFYRQEEIPQNLLLYLSKEEKRLVEEIKDKDTNGSYLEDMMKLRRKSQLIDQMRNGQVIILSTGESFLN